jgi:cholesterol transport system auxiliary component
MTLTASRALLCMVVAATLSACTLFPDRPANRIFQLPASTVEESITDNKPFSTTLRFVTPLAEGPVDSSRILVKPEGNEIKAYQGARWSNKSPILVRDQLVDAFRRDGRFAGVLTGTSPARSDLTIAGELNAFQSEYQDGMPVALIQLDLHLINERTRNTLASKRFEYHHPATGEQVEEIVEAFGEASNALAREVIRWTVEQRP